MHPLAAVLRAAAFGDFPPADGGVEVVGAPPGPVDAIISFTAHHLVAADVPPDEVLAQLPADDVGAAAKAAFVVWLGQRLRSEPGQLDLVLVAFRGGGVDVDLVEANGLVEHPRVARAARYRERVRVFTAAGGAGVLTLGRGLAGRLEVSIEVAPAERGRGLGRQLASAARALVEGDEPLFAQVTPGNTASVRTFLGAGYRPIGSEVLFLRA